MENKDSVSSNKLNLSDKLKKSGVKKLISVIAVLTIVLTILLLVLFNKHNKYSFRDMDFYCESIYTKPYLNKKVYCDMVAKNNGDTTMYLRINYGLEQDDIVMEPGAEVSFTSFAIEYPNFNPNKPDKLVGAIEIYDVRVPYTFNNVKDMQKWDEHKLHTLLYDIEHVGSTYIWKPHNH